MKYSKVGLRLWALLFPPVAFVLLWVSGIELWRKLLGSFTLLLWSGVYTAVIIVLLIRFTGLEVEWRGGYIPRLTYHKTRPDFAALEQSRAKSRVADRPPPGGTTNRRAAYWTSFRGPLNDGHYREQSILTNWPAGGLKLLWRQPTGGGYASFAVA